MLISKNNKSLLVYLVKIISLGLCYATIGRVSVLLAIPPGYATAIFPPAGIALASLLLWGTKIWPGVLLGSLTLNIGISIEQTALSQSAIFVAISAAIGATLQAWLSAKLLPRLIESPITLSKDKDILLFLLLAGPLACLISASFGVASLYALDIVTLSNATYNWLTWWVGDAIGVMIIVPLMFIAFAKPRENWRERRFVVAIPLVIMFSVVISLFIWVSKWELERNQFELKDIASNSVEKLRASFSSYVDAVASIERFYMSSTQSSISRSDFKIFVKYTLDNKPGINALGWNPVIAGSQRRNFEDSVVQEGFTAFEIKERNSEGQLIKAKQREEYVAVQFIEPMAGNEKAFGFNIASNPARRHALNQSRDQALALATARITLVQESGEQAGFLLFYPVYSGPHANIDQRRENIKGFAVGVFRVGDIADAVLATQNRQKVIVGIYDISDGTTSPLYGPQDYNEYGKGLFMISDSITVGGRQWLIVFWPSADYLASHNTWQAWAALTSGLLFTCMLGAFLLSMTGKSHYLNSEVKARTREIEGHRLEIVKTNKILEQRNEQLERSNQELDRYAFVASHDLKSPLQAIEQLASWIDEDCQEILPDTSKRHLTLLKQRIVRMKNLLADLLLFSRVSRNNYHEETINLQLLIEKAIAFNNIPEHFTINVQNCNHSLPLQVVPFELALRNLLSNSVKHHDKLAGNIVIEYTCSSTQNCVSVADDGPGIAQNLQDKAIEMFHTLKSRDETEGSGLGLSIVKKAMERINGHVSIISDGITGTKVELHWPSMKVVMKENVYNASKQ